VHDGILPSHLIFFFRHMSHACRTSAEYYHRPRCMYPGNAPSFGVARVAMVIHVILREHWARGHLRGVELPTAEDARRVHHGRAGGVEAIRGGIHGGS
jgi:hypothetical protein